MNLNDIIGLPIDKRVLASRAWDANRTVSFEMSDDKTALVVTEECDQYFSVALTPEEVDRLIAFLVAWRRRMVTT